MLAYMTEPILFTHKLCELLSLQKHMAWCLNLSVKCYCVFFSELWKTQQAAQIQGERLSREVTTESMLQVRAATRQCLHTCHRDAQHSFIITQKTMIYLSVSLFIYRSIILSIILSIFLSLSVCLSLSVVLSICLSVFHLLFFLSFYLSLSNLSMSICLSVCVCLSICLSICLFFLSIHLSIYRSIVLSFYLSF